MIVDQTVDTNYTKEQMFKLVADYKRYPEFIKVCTGAITHKTDNNSVIAELQMSFAGMKQKFSTRTTFYEFDRISMELEEGPFQRLSGFWSFENIENTDKCRVRVFMDYQMSSILEVLIGAKFKRSILSMIDSFIEQAGKVYQTN